MYTCKMKLSICCITYNHENFIAQALDGFLMQKTNFGYEIVIGEDCSTDKTLEIIKQYQERYPEKIKLFANKTNIGMMPNFIKILKECAGKYIALCEGDDYWTDPYKLQKQVNFLETNEDYAICFHEAICLFEDGKEFFYNNIKHNTTFGFLDLTQKNFISTASCVFRVNDYHRLMPDWFLKLNVGDWGLHLLNASSGKIYFFNDCMSVYRIHSGGVWGSLSSKEMCFKGIEIMDQLNEAFEFKYHKYFEEGKMHRLANFNKIQSQHINSNDYFVNSNESFLIKLKRGIKRLIKNS